MPLHPDFKPIKDSFLKRYKDRGEEVYHSWLNKHGLDDTKAATGQNTPPGNIKKKKEEATNLSSQELDNLSNLSEKIKQNTASADEVTQFEALSEKAFPQKYEQGMAPVHECNERCGCDCRSKECTCDHYCDPVWPEDTSQVGGTPVTPRMEEKCSDCNGEGILPESGRKCSHCDGTGTVEKEEQTDVNTDWTQPHRWVAGGPNTGENECWGCGKDYEDPIHKVNKAEEGFHCSKCEEDAAFYASQLSEEELQYAEECFLNMKEEAEKGHYPWDKCIADQKRAGKSAKSAANICGYIKARGGHHEEMSKPEEWTHEPAEKPAYKSRFSARDPETKGRGGQGGGWYGCERKLQKKGYSPRESRAICGGSKQLGKETKYEDVENIKHIAEMSGVHLWRKEEADGPEYIAHCEEDHAMSICKSMNEDEAVQVSMKNILKHLGVHKAKLEAIAKVKSLEAKDLSYKSREKLSDSDFAYPEERKLPINDAAHVRNALARFNQTEIPANKKAEVKKRICRAAKKFGIESDLCKSKGASEEFIKQEATIKYMDEKELKAAYMVAPIIIGEVSDLVLEIFPEVIEPGFDMKSEFELNRFNEALKMCAEIVDQAYDYWVKYGYLTEEMRKARQDVLKSTLATDTDWKQSFYPKDADKKTTYTSSETKAYEPK
jgi:Family of unknown function (DUF6582)